MVFLVDLLCQVFIGRMLLKQVLSVEN